MKVLLIRHGMTEGNRKSRYIGVTDEPLCLRGREQLAACRYPKPEILFASPLLRCRQTAGILFPGMQPRLLESLAECDFGDFENKNWRELSGDPRYQQWIDSGGTLTFPGGESPEKFRSRCVCGFEEAIRRCLSEKISLAAFVVHGGTIMSILERFARPCGDYYSWSVKNGDGYQAWLAEEGWLSGEKELTDIRKLEFGGENHGEGRSATSASSQRGREDV